MPEDMTKARFTVPSYDVPDVLQHLTREIGHRQLEQDRQPVSRFVAQIRRLARSARRRVKRLVRKVKRPFSQRYW